MAHTAASLIASPNPRILESRILLNHAQDDRFDFLKGRWKLVWERTKKDARAKRDLMSGKSEKQKQAVGGLIGGYESSDEDEDEEDGAADAPALGPPASEPPPPPPSPPDDDDDSPPVQPEEILAEEAPTRKPDASGVTSAGTEDQAEKQRLRRVKAEEWKRQRALAKGA